MILHDGIELPCILECIYVIEDKQAFRSGFEGQFIFQKNDPALNSWLIVEAAQSIPLNVKGFNGAIAADRDLPGNEGMDQVFSFRMKNMEPAPIPGTDDPAAYLPHVQFSTFNSWTQLGNAIKGEFLMRSMMNDVLKDSLETLLVDAETMIEKAHRIADFVDTHQRYINYDPKWFVSRVRSAGRVYETGYGVSMDQCVLTAAMMREAGFEVWPVMLSEGFGSIDEGVATLARFQSPGVWVSGPGVEAYFDPSTGTLHNGLSPIYNRSVWLPGFDDQPTLRWSGDGEGSRIVTSFNLSWDADAEMWTGSGYYEAGGGYCPFDKMEGGGDRSREYLNDVCSGVLSGADVSEFSPMSFDRFTVASDLSLSVPASERDDLDRLPFVIGDPTDGLIDVLPHYVPLYLAERGTPVPLAGSGEQVVKVKLNVAGLEVVRLPEPVTFNNGAGSFELTVAQDGDVVTIVRTISVQRSKYSVEEWTDLRALLLAEVSESNRTILLR
ncbi:hypothetical protein BMS3Bbin04_01711 [bacterium BMS3Bbin04]|nr:hypothetical protein BMS3Bbin04_01711 [bacterium BMS3Bbin04]